MLIHALMLVIQVLAAIFVTYWTANTHAETIEEISLVIVDVFLQMTVCYICWTQGSSVQLRRFELSVIPTQSGGLKFIIKRK
jgi:hypothetical protein